MDNRKNNRYYSTAERIVRKFFDGPVEREDIELVQGWLVSGDSREEIESALGSVFGKMVFFEKKPRRELIEALPQLRMKAGYSVLKKKTPLHHRLAFKIAAALIPLFMAGAAMLAVYLTDDRTDGAQHTVSLAVSDRVREIVLPDGSTVTLSRGGELAYAEDFGRNRAVELNGEACFRVTKIAGKPFTVKGDAITVTVRGTEFLLRAIDTEDTARVTLATGVVDVTAGQHSRTLAPGDVLTYNKRSGKIELAAAARGELLRVQGENLYFDGEPLGEIFKTAADYYGAKIDVGAGVDTRREIVVGFSGDESLEETMAILRKITRNGFNYTMENNIVTVTK